MDDDAADRVTGRDDLAVERSMRWLLPFAVLAVACSEYDIVDYEAVDVFNQEPAEQVDILLVVDNSGSMSPYQAQLAANFNAFILFFVGANVDYQIGVVTTTIQRPSYNAQNPACTPTLLAEIPEAGHLAGGTFITKDTPDADAVFQDLVTVGTCGAGYEMGLEAARRAFAQTDPGEPNAGFLRADAELSVIFVSDEQDTSPDPVNTYINDLYAVKGERERGVFDGSALVVLDEADCDNPDSTAGTRYIDVATQTHGVVRDLCSEDFAQIVTDLSLNASRLRDTFFLSQEPNPTTLQVTVGADVWPCEDGDWTFVHALDGDVNRPAIVFSRERMPQPGERIAVRYDQGNGDESLFCQAVAP